MDGDEEINIDEFKVAVSLTEADLTGAYTRNYRIRIVLVIGLIWCLMGTWAFAYTEGWDYTEGFYFILQIYFIYILSFEVLYFLIRKW